MLCSSSAVCCRSCTSVTWACATLSRGSRWRSRRTSCSPRSPSPKQPGRGSDSDDHPPRGLPRGRLRDIFAGSRHWARPPGSPLARPLGALPHRRFTYHPSHDAWICPEDQLLLRSEVDHERRLVRYRGRPQICNYCPAKAECTDSEEGREVVRAMDPWPHPEAGRFHRGISLAVALIAGLILLAEAIRNHDPLDLAVLGATLVIVALMAWHLHSAFRATPANFPAPQAPPIAIPVDSLRTGYRKSKGVRR